MFYGLIEFQDNKFVSTREVVAVEYAQNTVSGDIFQTIIR